jgi:hypothetical protein
MSGRETLFIRILLQLQIRNALLHPKRLAMFGGKLVGAGELRGYLKEDENQSKV